MADILPSLTRIIFILSVAIFFSYSIFANEDSYSSTRALSPEELVKPLKLTHLHFYFHDTITGGKNVNVMAVKVVGKNFTDFGAVVIINDLLTEGPDPRSKEIGRAQGLWSSASQSDVA